METGPGAGGESELPAGSEPLDGEADDEQFAMHPNVPRRGSLLAAFAAVTVCGALGALIGFGLVNTSCQEQPSLLERLLESVRGYHPASHHCAVARASGSVIGGGLAALGAAIVAVLMLRAMAEWRISRPDGGPAPS
jgi:hypothetical protein